MPYRARTFLRYERPIHLLHAVRLGQRARALEPRVQVPAG